MARAQASRIFQNTRLGTAFVLIDSWKTCLLCVRIALIGVAQCWWMVPISGQEPPLNVPDGFEVKRVADDSLAHDCFCMTLDAEGRPIISGPGYLKTLLDRDNDGVYDSAVAWTKDVKQGAQGLWVEGQTLYWVSDGGLWRSEDTDGDLVANTRPTKLLDLPTGGEHDAHSIQRGPDGYWYLVAGNFAANLGRMANDSSAPVTRARAGTLWRISPDFSRRGVFAHGLRNCYDFDFLPDGQIVTYDSDDEREATLPWYRPTRVMVLGPGSDGGWCGSAWKDDGQRVTMPQVLARLGRGSPTGVAVYQHRVFPKKYHDAVFVLDWTFGRVLAIYPALNLEPSQRIPDKIPSEVFIEPSGTVGFAPTDVCVAPDGSLLLCVGGRGTTGAIYRVSYRGDTSGASVATDAVNTPEVSARSTFGTAIQAQLVTSSDAQRLETILTAPAPWTAWSESQWRKSLTPAAKRQLLGVVSGKIPLDGPTDAVASRIQRAAQILTRNGERVPIEALLDAASASSSSRAAAWWIAGRHPFAPVDEAKLQRGLKIANTETPALSTPSAGTTSTGTPSAGTHWEEHLGAAEARLCWEAMGIKRWSMANSNHFSVDDGPAGNALRRTWLWALSRTGQPPSPQLLNNRLDLQTGRLLFNATRVGSDASILGLLSQHLSGDRQTLTARDQFEELTIIQAAMGDRRWTFPLQTDAPADTSDGYRGLNTNQIESSIRDSWARWGLYVATQAEKRGQVILHAEALRTMAMMEPSDPECTAYLLDQIQPDSHPTSDIHMLCCLAQCNAPWTEAWTSKVAMALAEMVRKVKDRGLYTDNQWPIRLNQLVTSLLRKGTKLGNAFIDLPIPCCNEDLALINAFPPNIQDAAKAKMRQYLCTAPADEWSISLVRYAAIGHVDEAMRTALRKASALDTLRPICVELLSNAPREDEYELYLNSLEVDDRAVWPNAWRGLASLDAREPQREIPAIAKLVSASLNTSTSLPRPAVLARARAIAVRSQLPAAPTTDAWPEWESYYRSQLDDAQWNELIPPPRTIDLEATARELDALRGDPRKGIVLYQAKCALCHGGQSSLGPSLVGVAKRFSTLDMAHAIYEPSRDISDRYRAVRVLTTDDEVLTGMIIYNAADGVTLQAGDGSILRINQDNIQEKAYSTESLMPAGLLEGKTNQEVADLFAYLRTF